MIDEESYDLQSESVIHHKLLIEKGRAWLILNATENLDTLKLSIPPVSKYGYRRNKDVFELYDKDSGELVQLSEKRSSESEGEIIAELLLAHYTEKE